MTNTELIIGLSAKSDGNMKLYPNEDNAAALANRQKYFNSLGIKLDHVVTADLIQGDNIVTVNESDGSKIIPETDGLITNTKDITLSVTVADCLPIYFYDSINHVVGLAHAGWKGVLAEIAGKMIDKMVKEFQTAPQDVIISIGPHLQACHFEVKEDVAQLFSNYPECIIRNNEHTFINLASIVKRQLLTHNVGEKNIKISDECTYDNDSNFFSYRRDKPERTEAMVAYLGLK